LDFLTRKRPIDGSSNLPRATIVPARKIGYYAVLEEALGKPLSQGPQFPFFSLLRRRFDPVRLTETFDLGFLAVSLQGRIRVRE
jgi:hypothetical protein